MSTNNHSDYSIVVPAVSAPSSLACLRSLNPRFINTIAISSDPTAAAFRSNYCDEALLVPSPHENLLAYKDALLTLAERPDVLTIIPVREEDIYVLSKYRDQFAEYVATPWPTLETLTAVQDRVQLFKIAADANVPAPATHRLSDVPDGPDWDREWVVKSRYSLLVDEYLSEYGPEQCVVPPTTIYLPSRNNPDRSNIQSEMKHDPLVQAYIPSTDEYGFFALYDHGEAVATFQHRQIRGYSYTGGASAFRKSVQIPQLEQAGRQLLDHLDWHGLAMVEFLRDETTGEFKLMEINPRLWSSLPFSVQTGADFPYFYWLLAKGIPEQIDDEYEVEIGGHLLRGELLYLYSILTEDADLVERPSLLNAVRNIAWSLVRHPRFDYLSMDDPRPFIQDARNTIQELRAQL